MGLRTGFKGTEVGMLPKDWEVSLLESVATRGSGHTPNKSHPEYWGGNVKWVSLQDTGRLDQLYIWDTAEKITKAGIENSSARLHPRETVVLLRDAGVGKSAILGEEMAVSQHFIAWTCGPRVENRFLYYWLQNNKREFERIAMGNTIKTIGLSYFKQLVIPLPNLPEQRRIADALSDVDSVLDSQARLVAKKRDLKLAAMQQLLSGRKRLAGFTGGWKPRQFGDLACPRKARVDPRVSAASQFCVELENIEPRTGRLLSSSEAAGKESMKTAFFEGDVLFGKLRAYLHKHWLADRPGVCSTEIWALEPKCITVKPSFLYQVVRQDSFVEAASMSYGTHMPRSDWNTVKNWAVTVPGTQEQSAIAQVLSDMDAEIEALEARREKTKALKQAMMQELLTGRTRLV